jgi:PIN domain
VPEDVQVLVFYGLRQKSLPEELVVQAQPLGTRLQWIKIAGQGPNALDFHIAYYLGNTLTERPQAHCAVLSKDKGFDPLIRHLHALGHTCRQVAALKDAFAAHMASAVTAPDTPRTVPIENYVRLRKLLKKEPKLPLKRKGLEGKVKSWFLQLGTAERLELVQRVFDEKLVAEGEKGLVLNL